MTQQNLIDKLASALRAVVKTYPYKRCIGKPICAGCKAQMKAEEALALLSKTKDREGK